MKTAIISFYKAFPPTSGAATVTYNIAKHLPGKKYLIQFSDEQYKENIDDTTEVINIRLISDNHFTKAVNLALQFPVVLKKISQISPEVIILEGASWALYCLILFSLLKIKKENAKVIYHAHNVEYLLRKQKNNKLIALITRWAEGIMMEKTDLAFAVSEVDADAFYKIYGFRPFILPNGVDIEAFEWISESDVQNIRRKYGIDHYTILFMGSYLYKPNREGIDFLVQSIMPKVIRKHLSVKLAVIGGDVPFREPWLIRPGIIQQDELCAFIKACGIGVAPIFSGSGTRLKILEYMASGIPVVSTIKGVEGITVKDGENILIADDHKSFVDKISYLMDNKEIAIKIGNRGTQMVKQNYSWQKIMKDFNRSIEELL